LSDAWVEAEGCAINGEHRDPSLRVIQLTPRTHKLKEVHEIDIDTFETIGPRR